MGPAGETSRARRCRTRFIAPFREPLAPRPNHCFETMSLIVKICGLSTPETLDAALAAGADMGGFVFFPPSPRHVSLEIARGLGRQVEGGARKVSLSVHARDSPRVQCVIGL